MKWVFNTDEIRYIRFVTHSTKTSCVEQKNRFSESLTDIVNLLVVAVSPVLIGPSFVHEKNQHKFLLKFNLFKCMHDMFIEQYFRNRVPFHNFGQIL